MGERGAEGEERGGGRERGKRQKKKKGVGRFKMAQRRDRKRGLWITAVSDMWLPCHPRPPKI